MLSDSPGAYLYAPITFRRPAHRRLAFNHCRASNKKGQMTISWEGRPSAVAETTPAGVRRPAPSTKGCSGCAFSPSCRAERRRLVFTPSIDRGPIPGRRAPVMLPLGPPRLRRRRRTPGGVARPTCKGCNLRWEGKGTRGQEGGDGIALVAKRAPSNRVRLTSEKASVDEWSLPLPGLLRRRALCGEQDAGLSQLFHLRGYECLPACLPAPSGFLSHRRGWKATALIRAPSDCSPLAYTEGRSLISAGLPLAQGCPGAPRENS